MPVILSGNNISTFSDGARSAPVAENQQFPGYQRGTFPATVASTNGSSVWMTDGVSLYAETWSYFNWTRIGQRVTIDVLFGATATGQVGDTSAFCIQNLPYKSLEDDADNNGPYYHNYAACFTVNVIGTTDYPVLFAQVSNVPSQPINYPGDQVIFQFSRVDMPAYVHEGRLMLSGGMIGFQLSYDTADTTWQPINGATIS
jgi:hypothetical protein